MGLISPSFESPSLLPIEMVIFVTVGGRNSVLGAIYGTLLVSLAKSHLSESFPELWTYLIGAEFLAVVMLFPTGLAGALGKIRRFVFLFGWRGPERGKRRRRMKTEMTQQEIRNNHERAWAEQEIAKLSAELSQTERRSQRQGTNYAS